MACWLAVDLGATNARFGRLDENGQFLGPVERRATAELGDGSNFGFVCQSLAGDERIAGVCVAVAGPVVDGRTHMTNGRVVLEAARLESELNAPVLLCNDFFALAHGLDDFARLEQLGGGSLDRNAMRAVLGPGSGLGMALCPPAASTDARIVLSSEGGYAPLAPATPEEAEVCRVLFSLDDCVCWESVLAGPGLVRLHEALALVDGRPSEPLDATSITEGALRGEPFCLATVQQFLAFLGSCAGGLAVTARATGGVYLAGGILPRLQPLLTDSALRARFDARGRMRQLVERIPLLLILDQDPGLIGASVLVREAMAR